MRPHGGRSFHDLGRTEAPGEDCKPERKWDHVPERGPTAPVGGGDRRLDQAERDAREECLSGVEPGDDSGDQPVQAEAGGRIDVERRRWSGEYRRKAGPDAGERKGEPYEE